MKTENILKLTKAGFTTEQLQELDQYNLDDIQALIDGSMTCDDIMKTLPVLAKVQAPAPTPTPNPAPAGSPDDGNNGGEPNPSADPINALASELKALRAAVQASNINNAATGTPAKQLSLEDVGAQFFNGNQGDKNNG